MIRFPCPHCKRGLKVKPELAGKRVKCANCQKPIQVPAAPPAPTAATPAHAEELAAQVFGDEPKPVEEKKPEGAPIALKCYYCDEDITFPADLAGKQAPCPSCRRIIKVPLPVKEQPKDWRTVARTGPSAAKQNVPQAPEGVWSASAKSNVSDEALYEADVLVDEVEPLSRQEKVRRSILYTVAGLVVLGIGSGAWRMWSASAQERTFRKAMQFVDKDAEAKTAPEIAAAVHRLAAEYYLRAGELDKANDECKKARGSLARARPGTVERDAELIDLALAQADLGGSKAQTKDHARLKWDDAQNELRQTLQKLSTPEARVEAMRLLTRKLLGRAQESEESKADVQRRPDVIARLVSGSPQETPELLAAVGLELLRADPDHAKAMAAEALKPYEVPPVKGADGKQKPAPKPPAAPSLIALLMALNQPADANKVIEQPAHNAPSVLGEARLGYAVGFAYLGNWNYAAALCQIPGDPNQRFQSLAAVAEVALDKSPEEAKKFVTAALETAEREQVHNSPWAARQVAWVAARLGLADKLPPFFDKLPPGGSKAEAQLAALRARLDRNGPADLDALNAEAAKKAQAYPRTLAFLSRHDAFQGSASAVQKAAGSWEPEALSALGYIGAALGMQDAILGTQQVAQKK